MDALDLNEQAKRININRNFTLECLKKTMPSLVGKIESEKYFIATAIMRGRHDDFYTIIDPTSRQIEHIGDFDEHCVNVYNSLLKGLRC